MSAMSSVEPSPGLVHPITSVVDRLNFARVFPLPQPLEVEIGSGDGSFLVAYAKAHPDRNFIVVERLLGRLRKLDKKATRAGLTNLRCVRLEATYFVEYLLPIGSVSAFHIYFPDPWPKRKHFARRLINEGFLASAHRALAPGGTLYLRTDNQDYFAHSQRVFSAQSAFSPIETPAELAANKTDFERHFNGQGIPSLIAAYRRGP